MFYMLMVLSLVLSIPLYADQPDLMEIKHLPTKPRVQDTYNVGKDAVIDQLLAMGKDAIPFLISRLASKREYKDVPVDLYPQLAEGDMAYFILDDLFTGASGHSGTTVPDLCWNTLMEASTHPGTPAWDLLSRFHQTHSHQYLHDKWAAMWKDNADKIVWDASERYFRIAGKAVVDCN